MFKLFKIFADPCTLVFVENIFESDYAYSGEAMNAQSARDLCDTCNASLPVFRHSEDVNMLYK